MHSICSSWYNNGSQEAGIAQIFHRFWPCASVFHHLLDVVYGKRDLAPGKPQHYHPLLVRLIWLPWLDGNCIQLSRRKTGSFLARSTKLWDLVHPSFTWFITKAIVAHEQFPCLEIWPQTNWQTNAKPSGTLPALVDIGRFWSVSGNCSCAFPYFSRLPSISLMVPFNACIGARLPAPRWNGRSG